MKIFKKIFAVVLLLAVLFPALHLDIITSFKSLGAEVESCINGAEVCDYGSDGSYLKIDSNGRLWLWTQDGYSLIADLSAELIAVYGDTLYYSSGERFYSYSLSSGDTEHIFSADAPIKSFAAFQSRIYYLSNDSVSYFENGHSHKLSLDLKNPSELPEGIDTKSPEKLRLESGNRLYVYYKNPSYIDESLCEIGLEVEDNTEFISCLYRVDKKEFSYVDPLLINETEIAESLVNASSSYTINGVSLPLSQYPVNSFFSKNGKSCTCHNKGICVAALSSRGCNCMRYYPSESRCEIDLLGSQCMGFARFCQWILYGAIDYNNPNFYNAFGKNLESGEWSASVLKSYIYKAGAGGHLRTGSGHSLFIINVDSTGFITYEANKSVVGGMCQVYTRTWTWESFYKRYGAYDLLQYKIPYNVDVGGGNDTPDTPENPYPLGTYITTAESGLFLREGPGTSNKALALLPYGTILTITETKDISGSGNYWGKTTHNGITGWISLEYAAHQTAEIVSIYIEKLPDKTNYTEGDTFSADGLVVQALMSNGTSTQISGYTCSGYNMKAPGTQTVTVTYGSHKTQFTIKVERIKIYPNDIILSEEKIVLLKGDTLKLDYTIYPLDATELDVIWECNNNDEAYISFKDGEITANGECTARITVKTVNGHEAYCDVQIVTLPKGTSWSSPMYQLPNGITTLDYQIQYGKVVGGNLDNVSWTYVPYGDEVNPKNGYVYRFRRYTIDLLVDGKSMPGYPQVTTVGTPLNLSKGDFLIVGSDTMGLFAGWYVHNSEKGSWDACASKYTVVGDTTMLASFIPLTPVVSDPSDPNATEESMSPFTVIGTEVYIGDNNYGLRFKTRISKQLISAIEEINTKNAPLTPKSSSSKGVGYGSVTVIASKISSNLVKGSTSASYLKDGSAVTVPAVNTHSNYTNYIIYTSLVLDYTSEYHKTNIAVRPYVTYYTCNGVSVTFYATMKGNYCRGGAYYTNLYARAEDLYKKTTDNNTKTWLKDNILTDK